MHGSHCGNLLYLEHIDIHIADNFILSMQRKLVVILAIDLTTEYVWDEVSSTYTRGKLDGKLSGIRRGNHEVELPPTRRWHQPLPVLPRPLCVSNEAAVKPSRDCSDFSFLHSLFHLSAGRVEAGALMTHQVCNWFTTRMCAHIKTTERVIQSVCATCKLLVCTYILTCTCNFFF